MTYELVIRGEIGDRFILLFEGMRLARASGTTVITGPVRDQSHLQGHFTASRRLRPGPARVQ